MYNLRFKTELIHGGKNKDILGSTTTPVYFSNAFSQQKAEDLEKIFKGNKPGYIYTRISNPTVVAFEEKIAIIEGGKVATATSSGMAAIYLTLTTILSPGDEIITSSGLFGGTYNLLKNFDKKGIRVKFLNELTPEELKKNISDKTKVFFGETVGNPKLDVLDIEEFGKVCTEHSIIFVVDSTVTTPYFIQPLKLGADIVIHSTSKYINGNSNSIGGVIIEKGINKLRNEKFKDFHRHLKAYGVFAFTARLKDETNKDIGAIMSPMNAFLNLVGVETLALRMKAHSENSIKIVNHFKNHEKILEINFPLYEKSKYYDLAQKYYENGWGAIITFRLGSKGNAFTFINNLKIIINLANIGDTRSLIIHPASTICVHNTLEEKENMGVFEDLVRISIGIEDVEDIIEDIENALSQIDINF